MMTDSDAQQHAPSSNDLDELFDRLYDEVHAGSAPTAPVEATRVRPEASQASEEARAAFAQRDALADESAEPKADKKKPRVAASFPLDHFTEDNIAPLFAASIRGTAAYVTEWRTWAVYDPTTGAWVKDSGGKAVSRLAKAFLKGVYDDAVEKGNAADEVLARRLRNAKPREHIMASAADDLVLSSTQFDADPHLFLAANGVVDLRTSTIREASASDYLHKRSPVRYLPGAEHEKWTSILSVVAEDTLPYLRVVMGQALTGFQPTDASVWFFHGNGSNGKSKIIDTVRACAGEYAANPSAGVLLKSQSSGATDNLMVFKGLRFAIYEELPDGKHLNAYVVKRLSGSQVMRAAQKYQAEEEFDIIATNFINTNFLPKVSEMDHGTWRRLKLIPLPYTFVGSTEEIKEPHHRLGDPSLEDWVKHPEVQEAALAWMVAGASEWFQRGKKEHAPTASMEEAKQRWVSTNDKIAMWWDELIEEEGNSFITTREAYASYAAVVKREGLGVDSSQSFYSMLEQHQRFRNAGAVRARMRHRTMNHSPLTEQTKGALDMHLAEVPLAERELLIKGIAFRQPETARLSTAAEDFRTNMDSSLAQMVTAGLPEAVVQTAREAYETQFAALFGEQGESDFELDDFDESSVEDLDSF